MKLVIAGTRDVVMSWPAVDDAARRFGHVSEVLHGGSGGVDHAAQKWAHARGIKATMYPAHWHEHGKAAGPIRNRQMASAGDVLIAFWDGASRGTLSMITEMVRAGKPVYVMPVRRKERRG